MTDILNQLATILPFLLLIPVVLSVLDFLTRPEGEDEIDWLPHFSGLPRQVSGLFSMLPIKRISQAIRFKWIMLHALMDLRRNSLEELHGENMDTHLANLKIMSDVTGALTRVAFLIGATTFMIHIILKVDASLITAITAIPFFFLSIGWLAYSGTQFLAFFQAFLRNTFGNIPKEERKGLTRNDAELLIHKAIELLLWLTATFTISMWLSNLP